MTSHLSELRSESHTGIRRRWLNLFLPVLVGLIAFLIYWPAQHGEFLLWDDDINIRNAPHGHALTPDSIRWMFTNTEYMRRYVPFTWLNWAVEREIFGLTPRSAHVGNILLHAANSVLVFLLSQRLLQILLAPSFRGTSLVPIGALFSALLWSLHPLRVEPVAWASGRIYCLATFFLLLACLAYSSYVQCAHGPWRRRLLFNGSVVAYVASLLTYPLALTFAGVLLILDLFVFRRFAGPCARAGWLWAEKGVFALAALIIGTITIWAAVNANGIWIRRVSLDQFGVLSRAAQAFYILAYYLWRPFFSFDLSPVYTTLITFTPGDGAFVGSAAGVVAVTAILIWMRRTWVGLLVLWLCHFCLLAPMLGVFEHPHYPNDRYSYFASVPWCVGAAALLLHWRSGAGRLRKTALVVAGLLLGAMALISHTQISIWRTSETLFRHMLATVGTDPYRADIHRRLGTLYWDQGRVAAAAAEFERAIAINPMEVFAHYGLGQVHEHNRQPAAAAACYRNAVRVRHDLPEAHARLGFVLYNSGDFAGALASFEARRRLQPDSAAAHTDLAATLIRLNRRAEALPLCERAAILNPNDPAVLLNLGIVSASLERAEAAIMAYRQALEVKPDYHDAHLALGRLFEQHGRRDDAIAHFQSALRLEPGLQEAREALQRLRQP